jgi:hypothetical protein
MSDHKPALSRNRRGALALLAGAFRNATEAIMLGHHAAARVRITAAHCRMDLDHGSAIACSNQSNIEKLL